MQLPISVVIPTMNRPKSLDRTLKFFFSGDDCPTQIIVVDQSQDMAVRDENQRILQKYSNAYLGLLYEYQQVASSTKARNRGLSKAVNEIIVFADDDIDVNPDTIGNVYMLMQDSNVAMVAGIDEFMKPATTKVGYLLGTKSFRKRKMGHVTNSMLGRYPDNITEQTETQWAMGYFFVVRKSLMTKWSCQWDENLTSYAYAEDLDFSFDYYKHAHREGMKCILDPSVRVKHLATREYRIPSVKSMYMYVVNRAYLSTKHNLGMKGLVANWWCNFWQLMRSLVMCQNPRILAHAMWCTIKYRKDISAGNLDYEKFMKGKIV